MTSIIQFAALQTNPTRSGDSGPGELLKPGARSPAEVPTSRPAPDWLELCRKEFCRRYWAENGDLIDDCNKAYGD